MLLRLTNKYITTFRPKINAFIMKLLYSGKQVTFGKHLKVDSIPRIIVDKDAQLIIGDGVELRRNVEIRVHNSAKIEIGNKVRIDRGVRILAANKSVITIQEEARIGLYSVLNGGDSIDIGKKVLISGFVYLQTSMHEYQSKEISVQNQGYSHSPIKILEDTWLGTHVVILPGCILGKGSIVGSNAVVTKNVNNYEVVAGVPAKTIKNRN